MMAKKPTAQQTFPQQARAIMSLNRIDVGNQVAHVRISASVAMPLRQYQRLEHCPDVTVTIAEIGE